MDETHILTSVSKAKAIARDQGTSLNDNVLGYLAKCADVNGTWWSLLGVSAPSPASAVQPPITVTTVVPTQSVALEVTRAHNSREVTPVASQEYVPEPDVAADLGEAHDDAGDIDTAREEVDAEAAAAEDAPNEEGSADVEAEDAPANDFAFHSNEGGQETPEETEAEQPGAEADEQELTATQDERGATEFGDAGTGNGEGEEAGENGNETVAESASGEPPDGAEGEGAETEDPQNDDLEGGDTDVTKHQEDEDAAEAPTAVMPASIEAPEPSVVKLKEPSFRASTPPAAIPPAVPWSPLSSAPRQPDGADVKVPADVVSRALEQLALHLVAEASAADSPAVMLANLQLAMEDCFREQRRAVQADQEDRIARITAKLRQVLSFRSTSTTVQEMNRLYDQVVYFVCMAGCMSDALHDSAFEAEVRAAVESVFPFSMLAQFLTLEGRDREQQLNELPYIVLGICLYHQVKRISGGDTLLSALQNGANGGAMIATCQAEVKVLHAALQGYAGALAKRALTQPEAADSQRLLAEALFLFQVHTHLHQLVMAVSANLESLDDLHLQVTDIVSGVDDKMRDMKAVPKQIIMPIFHKLGQLYETLLDENRSMAVNQKLLDKVLELQRGLRPVITTVGLKTAAQNSQTRDLPFTGVHEGLQPASAPRGLRMRTQDLADVELPPLSFGGADVVVLARHNGLPSIYSPDVDYVLYPERDGAIYAFSCEASLVEFMSRPDAYVAAATAVLRTKPHLIPVFGSMDPTLPRFVSEAADLDFHTTKCTCATQTPVHFIERHVDQTYQWNEWALRRCALGLANLQRKVTRSAQTAVSSFRRENETQYWQPRSGSTQTAVNKGQSMPKKMRYVAGLRGDPVTLKMNVVSLELDLGQPHQL